MITFSPRTLLFGLEVRTSSRRGAGSGRPLEMKLNIPSSNQVNPMVVPMRTAY